MILIKEVANMADKKGEGNNTITADFFVIEKGGSCREALMGKDLQETVLATLNGILGEIGDLNFPEPVYGCGTVAELISEINDNGSLEMLAVESIIDDLSIAVIQAEKRLPLKAEQAKKTESEIAERTKAAEGLSEKFNALLKSTADANSMQKGFEKEIETLIKAVKDALAPTNKELAKYGFQPLDLSNVGQPATAQQMVQLLLGEIVRWTNDYAKETGGHLKESEQTARVQIGNLKNLEKKLAQEVNRLKAGAAALKTLQTDIKAASDKIAGEYAA